MTETAATPAGVIPYIDHHTGPKRLVTVTMEPVKALVRGVTEKMMQPTLHVDGRPFIVYWGRVTVEAPADRAVHLAVGLQDGMRGASVLLEAGTGPAHLLYQVPGAGQATLARVHDAQP